MKLLYFDDFKLGVLKGDAVVDVSAEVKDIPHTGPGDLMNGLIEHWDSYKPRIEAAVARGTGVPLKSVRIRPPIWSRSQWNEISIAFSSSACWKVWLSRSPAPSSSRPASSGCLSGSCCANCRDCACWRWRR